MMRELRHFAAAKQGVAFPPDLLGFSHHEVRRKVIRTQNERKNFDRRFEFLRHNIVRTQLMNSSNSRKYLVRTTIWTFRFRPLATCTARLVMKGSEIATTKTLASSILTFRKTFALVASP